ncbi:heme ABC transporter ATP-binding protein [Halocynthiibacter namhaensis]|uniref:heme ABC transporter ATP-binding protein n=1 Tax=Halocynthiibacter namhaensis TaxID=1290553 RepID=UPI0005791B5C|nr:heme ABC transporter ATP-binding protein [Halocynthiibacter namhaensis]
MLKAKNITVSIGRTEILHGIDFTAKPGEFTAIIGPNGCGKTTLLRALTGEMPYGGQVIINGRDLSEISLTEQAIMRGVLAQSTPLAFPFTVSEVVRLGLMAGTGSANALRRNTLPQQALSRVDLADYGNRFFQELSGGEQQRVHLARVLCQMWEASHNGLPRWLFLDEPVASLDIAHQRDVMQIARDFADQGGGAVAVMHDLNLTAAWADHIVMMRAGRVVSSGNAQTVYTNTNLSTAYGCTIDISTPPPSNQPFLHPASVISCD